MQYVMYVYIYIYVMWTTDLSDPWIPRQCHKDILGSAILGSAQDGQIMGGYQNDGPFCGSPKFKDPKRDHNFDNHTYMAGSVNGGSWLWLPS